MCGAGLATVTYTKPPHFVSNKNDPQLSNGPLESTTENHWDLLRITSPNPIGESLIQTQSVKDVENIAFNDTHTEKEKEREAIYWVSHAKK